MLQEADDIKHAVVLIIQHIECLPLMYSEVAWVLVLKNSRTQAQPQVMLNPDYLPEYISVFYDLS